MYKIISYFSALEVFGLLGFIYIAQHQEGTLFRFLPLLVVLAIIGFIAFLKMRTLSYKKIAYVSIIVSIIFISVIQILGFTVYHGLVKGVTFISWDNAIRVGVVLFICTIGHFLLLLLVRKLSIFFN
ncbi:MAG: hypothetical protein KZQ74_03140 [gamma proteobacterium symbiont of Bathyaustriella thionipta]|nr:hypothetical protein [gamma proteobacterium symbiont of Bathyaustriella thionipta]